MTDPAVPARRAWWWRALPWGWAVVLTALLLGPALGPGYVLTHDMVWVPDLGLHPDVFGLGTALPRAVPSDAVVGVLDEVVPGAVLQRIALVGALLLAAGGSMRLAGESMAARLVAVSLAVWSPYVVERLWMGHWPMLLAYGALPWLVVAGRRTATTGRPPAWTYLLLVVGSLSANAGLASAAALLATGVRRRPGVALRLIAACVAANAPWLVTGLLHASEAADTAGYGAFALHGDALPGPLSALTLGGIWNVDTVPGSRDGLGAWVGLALVLVLGATGVRRWTRRTAPDQRRAIVGLWAVGMGIAIVSWAAPDALAWLGGRVPGLGLLRDGSRMLLLCLPLLVSLCGAGAETCVTAMRAGAPGVAAALVVVLLPVGLMPDAAGGIGGVLSPSHYPSEWRTVAAQLPPGSGDALLLPLGNYRAPAWNGGRPVIDPLARLLRVDVVMDDDLVVAGKVVPGEDPRVAAARAALAGPTPGQRAAELTELGFRWVVIERDAGRAPEVAGRTVHRGALLTVVSLPAGVPPEVTAARRAAIGAAWILFAALLGWGVVAVARAGSVRIATRRSDPANVRH